MSDPDLTGFTHLHVHSHYSLLKATASAEALVARAAAEGLAALALTDDGGLYGAVAFAVACRAAGIKPITGMCVPVAAPRADVGSAPSEPGQLVLLATGAEGYRSLCRLSASLQAHPDRETRLARGVGWAELKAYHQGLICIEAGQAGWLARRLRDGQEQAASQYAGRLGGIFQDRCYIGLALSGRADVAPAHNLVRFGSRFGMRPVVAQPVTCLERSEAALLPLLAAIDRNCLRSEVADQIPDRHWLSPEVVAERFAEFPEAIANVAEIVAQCEPALPGGAPIWPALDLPPAQTAPEALVLQAEAGLAARLAGMSDPAEERGGLKKMARYGERLAQELASITRLGFAPLFLLVADIVRFAHGEDIPVSTRGSVANSLVAYALGITTVDPVAQGLLFERFLNPARANLPDIDLDFCSRRRDEVLAYVRQTYGEDRVALVGTMNRLQPKSAMREVAKAYGFKEARLKRLSALAPRRWHPDPRRRQGADLDQVLAQLEDEEEREVVRLAFRLVGQPHHLSLHPGGIVISPGPMTDVAPVQWATKGYRATQYDYRDVEKIGLPKIDLLGIRALTVLADTAEAVRAHHDPGFRLDGIPLDDEATAKMLSRGETIGVFQCESSGSQRTLRQLKASTVRDLAVANAFFKPGPATGGMAKSFIRRYRGEEPVSFLHAALAPILEQTKGVLLFQEQVLRIAVEIAGLSWTQADHLRRGMSKFRSDEMGRMRVAFTTGCRRPPPDGAGFSAEQAETLWEQVMAFAGYGFNQGHATAYADVSYRSAYLKRHYPAEFLSARLMDRGGYHHPAIYMAEARRLGLRVRPPHVNVSGRKLTLTPGDATRGEEGATFWLGLGQVRDLRKRSIGAIVAQRPFESLADLLERVPMQAKEINHLIQCGGLDGLAANRMALLAELAEILRAGSARQMAFAFMERPVVTPEGAGQRLRWEQQLLGMPVSVFPTELVEMGAGTPLRQLPQLLGEPVRVVGARLPGWTGGKGWFLSDGDSFIIARGGERPDVWQPVALRGRYRSDEWGGGWFQVESGRQVLLED
jgi:DNA-directed DNA polymerase III PolC